MYDTIIRNGTIIDGTGADRYVADIALKDGRVAAIGEINEQSKNEINAKGKLVTPGWLTCIRIMMVKPPGILFWLLQVGMV